MDKTRSKNNVHGLSDLSTAQVAARMAEIGKHLDAVETLLADAKALDAAQRQVAVRLRGDEETTALEDVLAFTALHGELFTALADEDEGTDPTTFETGILVTRLQNVQTLSAMAERVASLHEKLADCALYTTQLVKPIALKAYELGKPFANRVSHGELLFPAKNYYRAAALSAARTRGHKRAGTTSNTPSVPANTIVGGGGTGS